MKLALIVTAVPGSEHSEVEPEDLIRAVRAIESMVRNGATAGRTEFNVPHSHMGDSCNAAYWVNWEVTGS